MTILSSKLTKTRAALLAGAGIVAAGGAVAFAQSRRPLDPASMPEFRGTIAQYDLTPRGDVDGLILADGTEVHFPPHLGKLVQAAVKPGDAVVIRGDRNGPVVRAGSVAPASGGTAIVDRGPPPGGPLQRDAGAAPQRMEAVGAVKMPLHGPRGELNGALLSDGTIVHLPPHEAERFAASLKAGATIAVRGEGVEGPAGRSIGARAFGPSLDDLTELKAPPRPPRPGSGPGAPPPVEAPAPASKPG